MVVTPENFYKIQEAPSLLKTNRIITVDRPGSNGVKFVLYKPGKESKNKFVFPYNQDLVLGCLSAVDIGKL